jgi:hypothetical protein
MHSIAQTTHVGLEIINENRVTGDSQIINETASTGDAWIRQRKEPMRAMQSSTKTESLPNQKSSTKLLPRVRHGFDSANSPFGLRNHHRKRFHKCRMHSTAQTAHMGLEIINEN